MWEDLDHDGVQDAGEPGIPGVLVTLQTPTGTVTTTTDASGNYTFTNLISGTYAVTFTAPSGYSGTLPNVGGDGTDSDGNPITGATGPITVNAGDAITNVDAGFWRPATIASQVWEDHDHDGVRDPGEPGIPGIIVSLQTPTGTITTTTDASGNYTFTNLISGTHSMTYTAPATTYTNTLTNPSSTLTNTVWQDLDGDGVRDPGEPGLPGIVVTLQTPTGTMTTTTDASGNYTFTNLTLAPTPRPTTHRAATSSPRPT